MPYHHLVFYVPITHCEQVKEAVFLAGAGRMGHYDRACWQTQGTGQFRPIAGANPFIGQQGIVEYVPEMKVETICSESDIPAILQALKQTHPYEEPAFFTFPIAHYSV